MKQYRIKGIRRRTGKWYVENWINCNETTLDDLKWQALFNNSFYKKWTIQYREV